MCTVQVCVYWPVQGGGPLAASMPSFILMHHLLLHDCPADRVAGIADKHTVWCKIGGMRSIRQPQLTCWRPMLNQSTFRLPRWTPPRDPGSCVRPRPCT